jgi:hypothetical protein
MCAASHPLSTLRWVMGAGGEGTLLISQLQQDTDEGTEHQRSNSGCGHPPDRGGRVRASRRTSHSGVRPGLARVAASARRHLTQVRGGGFVLIDATQPMAIYLHANTDARYHHSGRTEQSQQGGSAVQCSAPAKASK